ncbi:hypothetical protein [Tetragenococcus halophilus]|uniref:Uncharacterized protein n=1 Tax=Tetragenococcus halophilus (strain DSM 20338 / JCM 20259 / NCIMB 9735 / NBRC 12172) TaxID=945021 RepID=A0AAN1VRC6_TETHN|nr:hypothetical protein [Tetragenococcus halophilus]BAK94171.1 hypothetical protein TEH_08440 [Tetragenococcus halophilus NBRC 12172]GBD70781.1 putative uncharacterized protein [Tetragenococcus halophilus subsp. halophilus]
MIKEVYNFANGGLNVETPSKPVTEKQGIKVGDACRAKSEMFSGWLRCEVVKLYQNAAMVKIIACRNPQDDVVQHELDDVAIVRIRDLTVLKEVS